MSELALAARLLRWFDQHGRHGLPWQHPRSAYRVWLSEVMLQQTQVVAAIPYFQRFVTRFPDIATLAEAPADEVMRYWAGLGYYARARNLHAAAKAVVQQHGGVFPTDFDAALALPGIGRSTAGAILAQAFGARHAILDGNVKRVLARWAGISGYPGAPAVAKQLWAVSERELPDQRLADYTQALMDLGATLCTARCPRCADCPLSRDCIALKTHRVAELPASKPKPTKARPHLTSWLVLAQDGVGRVLVQQRPGAGIWGGLWCPPVIELVDDRDAVLAAQGLALMASVEDSAIEHAFSHYDLTLRPLRGHAQLLPNIAREETIPQRWLTLAELHAGLVALPAPVSRYFERLAAPADLLGHAPVASVRRPQRRKV